jgi:hypothetical protein
LIARMRNVRPGRDTNVSPSCHVGVAVTNCGGRRGCRP